MPKPKRRRRPIAEIQKILSDLQDSGLSHLQFASNHNIAGSTLENWIRKHRSSASPGLPEVIPVGTLPVSAPVIEIELPGGAILRLGAGFAGADLACALSELRRC